MSLPMYDWLEQQSVLDDYWKKLAIRLRAVGIDAPLSLSHYGEVEDYWLDENLLLGQTCGYPLSTSLKDRVRYVATPVYEIEGCKGASYSSAIIGAISSLISQDELAGRKFAFNSRCSLSGYRVVRKLFGNLDNFFELLLETGGHRNSARAVATGKADVAGIDAVCWHMLRRYEPGTAEKLQVLGWTEMHPSLPLITSLQTSDKVIQQMQKVLVEHGAEKSLAISGYEILDMSDYDKLAFL